MAYTIRQVPNEPIIVIVFQQPLAMEDAVVSDKAAMELAEKIPGKVYIVSDGTIYNLTLDQVIDGMDQMRRFISADSRFVRTIVGTARLVEFAVQAAKQRQYGARDLLLFASVDEAVEYARKEIAKEKAAK